MTSAQRSDLTASLVDMKAMNKVHPALVALTTLLEDSEVFKKAGLEAEIAAPPQPDPPAVMKRPAAAPM